MFDQGEHSLRGVVHAAGIDDNGVLSTMTPQRFATIFAPKVAGAWNLHQLTQSMDLDFFMMFSSISGVLGSLGLGNYAAANTFPALRSKVETLGPSPPGRPTMLKRPWKSRRLRYLDN